MKYDIRDLYGPDDTHADIMAAILEGRPPRFHADEAKPGFDCLIVVLRRIYSHVMLGTSLDWLADSEKENPVLRLAWHTFDDEEEELNDAYRERRDVLNVLASMGLDPDASFEELCNSSLMNKTFWSQDEFRLTNVLYCMETFQKVDGSPDEISRASLLELDHVQNPGLLLQEVVDKSFGVVTKKDKQVMCRPNSAVVVRVLYKANADETQRPDINGLRSLSIPLWEQDMHSDDVCFQEVGRAEYCIIAVVRIDQMRGDKVRTYGVQGSNIVAEREPREIMDHDWSLKHGGKFMLFYGPQTMENPEVAGPMISEEDSELLQAVGKSLKDAMSSLQNSKPSDPPAQQVPKAAEAVESSKAADGPTSAQSTGQGEPEESHPDPDSRKRKAPQGSQEGSTRKRSKRSRREKAGPSNDSSRNNGQDDSEPPNGSRSKQDESERRRDARRSPPRR